ncbi:Ku protein [Streptomyces sp. NPDC006552]|uniref:non-homologous end joining protein Ku n=1 Tax=Streptomyces sp. NPDC006552 TaxID=3157179 RepID=UPI0033BB9871
MRSIWNGAVSFGLVSIPIKLINATENHAVSFRQVHLEDGGRIRYRKVCELEDKEVGSAEIGKGYVDADGSVVPITDEDLAALPSHTEKTIEILAFVPADRIDPLQMDTAYYLSANGAHATKPYTLLREALRQSQKVAIARFALRGRERLGMLRVTGDVIALHGLMWPDEIRSPQEVAPDTHVTVRDAELDLADALMDTLGEVDMATLHDDYRAAVEEMVAAKVAGGDVPETPSAPDSGGKVLDLMAALESSVRAAKQAQGKPGTGGDMAEVTSIAGRSRKKTAPRKKPGKSAEPPARKAAPPAKKTASAASSAKKSATSKAGAAKKPAPAATKKPAPAAMKKKSAAKKSQPRKKTSA